MLPNKFQLPIELIKNDNKLNFNFNKKDFDFDDGFDSSNTINSNSLCFHDIMSGRPLGSQEFIDKLQLDELKIRNKIQLIRDWGNSWIIPYGKRQTQLDEDHDVSFYQFYLLFTLKLIVQAEISIEEDYIDVEDDDNEGDDNEVAHDDEVVDLDNEIEEANDEPSFNNSLSDGANHYDHSQINDEDEDIIDLDASIRSPSPQAFNYNSNSD